MIEFAHLHCHSIFSIQDSMLQMRDYVNEVYRQNMTSSKYRTIGFAITDHGTISGMVEQYTACEEPDNEDHKTKAIYGVEVYHCYDVENNPNANRFHLVLLAKNNEGLKNIYKICTHAGMHLYHGKQKNFPVTDMSYLSSHGNGIIASSACLGGLIPQCILSGNIDAAERHARYFKDVFDEFYLELQAMDDSDQLFVNTVLCKISKKLDIPLIITSDSHYLHKDDKKYHDILKSIAHQKPFGCDAYLRTPEEFEDYCLKNNYPLDCISNTGKIANSCTACPKPANNRELLPVFPCPSGFTEESYLRQVSLNALRDKIIEKKIDKPYKYISKALYELDIICSAGYAGYFLILWDWFKWCRDNGILMGPGRGSAAASIISYVLDITKVDPIKNNFIFSRFLNEERLSFPDVDSDVPRDKRAEAIAFLQKRYGVDNVSQIITFGKYKLKNTAKAILSNLGVPYAEANTLTRGIPDLIDGKEVTWELIEGFHNNPDSDKYSGFSVNERNMIENIFKDFEKVFNRYPQVYDGIRTICGCIANTGVHAGGVVICCKPIGENFQIFEPIGKAVLPILQLQMNDLEFYGFLKIDALGLRTLDIIKLTMDLTGVLDYAWYDSEDYSDPKVYEMLRNGETTDIFQMAGFMATKLIQDFNVKDINGLTAVNAGNRPGPLEKDSVTGKSMTDLYTERVQTGVVPSIDPRIDDILKTTYGCLWYQEQCISLGQVMAGYTQGGADSRIRKTLGKKLVKKIPEIRNEFIYGKASEFDDNHEIIGISEKPSQYCEGAVNRGFDEQTAVQIFDTMSAFSKYSFNLSHAFCYAVTAYKCAWLSLYYPVEFAVACCTIYEDVKDIINTLSIARKRKIPILGPDINSSGSGFTIEQVGVKEGIRYGIRAVKNVGEKAIDFLEAYKAASKKPFKDFDDFYTRIHDMTDPIITSLLDRMKIQSGKNTPNPIKKNVELSLIFAGCFDYAEPDRYKLAEHYLVDIKKEKSISYKIGDKEMRTFPKYQRKEKLMLEKEFMGAYISEHPLDSFAYADFDSTSENDFIKTTVLTVSASLKETKRGLKFLSIKGTDKTDSEININLFDSEKAICLKSLIRKNSILIVSGTVSRKYNNINANDIKIAKKMPVETEALSIPEPENTEPERQNTEDNVMNVLHEMFG